MLSPWIASLSLGPLASIHLLAAAPSATTVRQVLATGAKRRHAPLLVSAAGYGLGLGFPYSLICQAP